MASDRPVGRPRAWSARVERRADPPPASRVVRRPGQGDRCCREPRLDAREYRSLQGVRGMRWAARGDGGLVVRVRLALWLLLRGSHSTRPRHDLRSVQEGARRSRLRVRRRVRARERVGADLLPLRSARASRPARLVCRPEPAGGRSRAVLARRADPRLPVRRGRRGCTRRASRQRCGRCGERRKRPSDRAEGAGRGDRRQVGQAGAHPARCDSGPRERCAARCSGRHAYRRRVGWAPAYDLDTGLERTIDWWSEAAHVSAGPEAR